MPQGILDYILTEHAESEFARRNISRDVVSATLTAPEQRFEVRPGREVFQSRVDGGLIRVFVDVDRQPAEVVTAYITSKIQKYWRAEP